jgi:integrase
MAGNVYKRCPCGTSGTRGKPACRKAHGSWCWRADGDVDRATGKRRQLFGSGFATQQAATDKMVETLAAKAGGSSPDDRNQTVAQWLTTWLEQCRARVENGSLELKTYVGYESHVRVVLIPHLGTHRLRELRHRHIEKMVQDAATPDPVPPTYVERQTRKKCGQPRTGRGAGKACDRWAVLGQDACNLHGGGDRVELRGRVGRVVERRDPGTLSGYVRTLRAALNAAVRRDLIAISPAAGRIESMPARRKRDVQQWEPDGVARFLLAVQSERLAALYDLAAFAGLRRAELLGLKWSDLDLTSQTPGVQVRTTLVTAAGKHDCVGCGLQHTGRYLKPPKSHAGDRWVALVPGTIRELIAHQAAQSAERDQWGEGEGGAYVEHGLVFAMPNGDPLQPDAVTKQFVRLAAEHGLPRIHLHDMRHGACSLLLAAGMPIELVSKILGHANTETTRRIYAHVLRAPASEWMRAAERLVRAEAA